MLILALMLANMSSQSYPKCIFSWQS